MFHIPPKLQAKRADFLSVMLAGSLNPRRSFIATPPVTPEDVTKSESDSVDHSQDGPPSTLLAIDPQKGARDPGSVADVDLDQEDISKTLVLFSPGDMRRSFNSGAGTDVLQSEKEAVDLQTCLLEKNQQLSPKRCDAGDCGIISLLQQKFDPLIPTASPTSPPLTNMQKPQTAHEPLEHQNKHNNDRIPGIGVKQETNQSDSSTCPLLTNNHLEQEHFKNQCDKEDGLGMSMLIRQKNNPSTTQLIPSGSAASSPFTKVEKTFIHIAETTHLNIMSSLVPQVQQGSPEVLEDLQCEVEPQNRTITYDGIWFKISSNAVAEEIQGHNVVIGPAGSQVPAKVDIVSPVSMGMQPHVQREKTLLEKTNEELQCQARGDKPVDKSTTPCYLRSRSRIPIMVSEDGAAADPSLFWNQTKKWSKQQEFARLVLERQRQMLNSRTSSSLSSGDEPRRASETLSTTEEETHQSEDSFQVKQDVRERGGEGWSSRIPRPVTPIKRAPARLLLTISSKSTARPETAAHTANTGYVFICLFACLFI